MELKLRAKSGFLTHFDKHHVQVYNWDGVLVSFGFEFTFYSKANNTLNVWKLRQSGSDGAYCLHSIQH